MVKTQNGGYNKDMKTFQVERRVKMVPHQPSFFRRCCTVLFITIILVGLVFAASFSPAQAEGNPPTNTPPPTSTLTPSITPSPTTESQSEGGEAPPENNPVETSEVVDKSVEQEAGPENAAPVQVDEQQTDSASQPGDLSSANLCLIGAIVVVSIIVMIMIVYGIFQRVRA
jgi:hypothetical protein